MLLCCVLILYVLGRSLALQALSRSSEGGEEPWRPLIFAQEILQSALSISQASANRDCQLEADILYCTGTVLLIGSVFYIGLLSCEPVVDD